MTNLQLVLGARAQEAALKLSELIVSNPNIGQAHFTLITSEKDGLCVKMARAEAGSDKVSHTSIWKWCDIFPTVESLYAQDQTDTTVADQNIGCGQVRITSQRSYRLLFWAVSHGCMKEVPLGATNQFIQWVRGLRTEVWRNPNDLAFARVGADMSALVKRIETVEGEQQRTAAKRSRKGGAK